MVRPSVASATEGAAPNKPAKLLGFNASPRAANNDTMKPPKTNRKISCVIWRFVSVRHRILASCALTTLPTPRRTRQYHFNPTRLPASLYGAYCEVLVLYQGVSSSSSTKLNPTWCEETVNSLTHHNSDFVVWWWRRLLRVLPMGHGRRARYRRDRPRYRIGAIPARRAAMILRISGD